MEHFIEIYDVVKRISYNFDNTVEARDVLGVQTRQVLDLKSGKSRHIDNRYIRNDRRDLLTTIRDVATGEEFEIFTAVTLGIILGVSSTKHDAAALCLLKGNRANMASIMGRKFTNPNADPEKIGQWFKKISEYVDDEKVKEYRNKTFEQRSIRKKKWNKENKERVRIYNNQYTTSRRKRDVSFRMRMNLRSRIKLALKGETKRGSIISLIGCSMDFLKRYIQDQFDASMNWENYGEIWTIDHIIPCSFFDLSIEDHQRMCCYYKNLRPLCKIENGKKLNHLPSDYRSFISDNLIEASLYPVTAYKLMLAGHANL